jgi:hypothetical protein
MKGTLFSSDFIKDSNGNLRLLEVNTDTAISNGGLSHADFTDLFNLLSSEGIDRIVVIYKKFQENFVDLLSEKVTELAPFIEQFERIIEESTTVYPTSVVDEPNKFILRMAYDEAAIFDSTYCANSFNTLNLFKENNNESEIPNFYYNSSENGIVDNLSSTQNIPTVPDLVSKNTKNLHQALKYIKVGGSGSLEENFTELKGTTTDGELLLNFYNDDNSNRASSLRSVDVIYSNNGSLSVFKYFKI